MDEQFRGGKEESNSKDSNPKLIAQNKFKKIITQLSVERWMMLAERKLIWKQR